MGPDYTDEAIGRLDRVLEGRFDFADDDPPPYRGGDVEKRPRVNPRDVQMFVSWLTGRGWTLARDMALWSERTARQLAQQSGGQVISGQQGYRLTAEATDEEIARACHFLESQAQLMLARARAIRAQASS